MMKYKWKVTNNVGIYQVWRQTRPLRAGEPMHSGVRETRGCFDTKEEAQLFADNLNSEMELDNEE